MSSSLVSQLESLLKQHTLTRQDVLELTECAVQIYLEQQIRELSGGLEEDDEEDEQTIDIELDDEGDYIDKEGYIYDVDSRIRIGQKDLKTKEKTMFNVV